MLVGRLFSDTFVNPEKKFPFFVWLKRVFARCWNARPLIEGGSICHGILTMMKHVYTVTHASFPAESYLMQMVSACVTTVDLAESWLKPTPDGYEHILQWSFMIPTDHLYLFFRSANHLLMR
jgi:hypothetical protein